MVNVYNYPYRFTNITENWNGTETITTTFSDGVTTHDAIIVNENDAVVIQLKGLQLKGMAPLTDDQRFTFTDV